jgi:hypothetical protein
MGSSSSWYIILRRIYLSVVENKKQKARLFAVLSFLSISIFILLILFLIKQGSMVFLSNSIFTTGYSQIYYILLVSIPILLLFSLVLYFLPKFTISSTVNSFLNEHIRIFRIFNIIILGSTILIAVSLILFIILSPIRNNKPGEMTVLFDRGSLCESIVKALFTPLALKMYPDNFNISVLPLNKSNIISSFEISEYVVFLSHGEKGKLYSTSPTLEEYSYQLFKGFSKDNVKFVYFSACYLGVDEYTNKWKNALKPAKVILYNRESAALEHMVWALFQADTFITKSN